MNPHMDLSVDWMLFPSATTETISLGENLSTTVTEDIAALGVTTGLLGHSKTWCSALAQLSQTYLRGRCLLPYGSEGTARPTSLGGDCAYGTMEGGHTMSCSIKRNLL